MDDIEVSILCTTYNQKEYVCDAIDSFLSQKTQFKFEILINDDASSDGTTDLLLMYEKKYPDLIRVVTHTENQFSKGQGNLLITNLLPLARGKYLALCEGDDYWCSSEKLQKQFDVMQRSPDCVLCVHASRNVLAQSRRVMSNDVPFDSDRPVSTEYMLLNAHPFATNSYFIRKTAFESYARSQIVGLSAHGDQKMSTYLSVIGQVFYIAEIMSCYRVLAKGSINSTIHESGDFEPIQRRLLANRVELLDAVDVLTEGQYKDVILQAKRNMNRYYLEAISDWAALKADFPEYYARLSPLKKIKLKFAYTHPELFKELKRIGMSFLDR